MSQFFRIHPETPQHRLIHQAAEIVRGGGVIAYPTDSAYAIGCHIGDKNALTRIRQLRKLEDDKNFTLVCEDLSALGTYARVSNSAYRMIRSATPGPYTFIFPATKEVPRRLVHPKRKTIGVRVPDNAICTALLRELGEPLMSATLIMPGEQDPLSDAYEIRERLEHQLDLVIDGGYCGPEPTTVISFEQDVPSVVRAGRGDVSSFTS
jgi:tRNA threonylcarbamoyl adenosine modification protein (Sua5/YciO/YrdC/YwlC family)